MFEIREEASLERFLALWEECMKGAPWFDSDVKFWYKPEEELERLDSIHGGDSFFLIACHGSEPEPLGVLSVQVLGSVGKMGPWEPGVTHAGRGMGVGEALLERACEKLGDWGVEKLEFTLRYPCDAPAHAAWLDGLYRGCGFSQRGPTGLQMLADLSQIAGLGAKDIRGLRITGRENLSIDDLVGYTLRAFSSDPRDKTYFSWDPLTTTKDGAQRFFNEIFSQEMGRSPPEFFRVAWIDGEPAGFAGSFARKNDETRGVVGPVGVFPEYRRRGIATALVLSTCYALRSEGYRYAYLGTHVDNLPARRMYEGIGFKPVFNTVEFERILD
ncbi:GNAT family N-acetyltransferase [Candidatus Bathyarchaeota archaeon]|nr:GNAT family N-acetyltransferase [Candidatus Bathyarchaeota archaeon]